MSAMNSVDFKFLEKQDPTAVLDFLLANGWTYNCAGTVHFIFPETVKSDDFDWRSEPIDSFDYENYRARSRAQNRLLIRLMLVSEAHGGDFMIGESDGWFYLGDDLVRLTPALKIADFSWYIRKLENMFAQFRVYSFNCSYLA